MTSKAVVTRLPPEYTGAVDLVKLALALSGSYSTFSIQCLKPVSFGEESRDKGSFQVAPESSAATHETGAMEGPAG